MLSAPNFENNFWRNIRAQQLDAAIKQRQFRTSALGKELTHSLTDHILAVNKSKATADDIQGLMRYLLEAK